jgi:pimeloyl-ACP methyl ester carboxylesterase
MMDTAPARLESKFVTVEGVKLHYQECGSGDPVVGIHGAGPGASSESNFKLNRDAISKDHRFIMYDMPQFGQSDKVVISEGRLAYNSRILKGFLSALGLEKVGIVGNSMGGQVGLKFSLDYPEMVDRIVILGSGAVPSFMSPQPVEGVRMIGNFYKGVGPTKEKLRELLNTIVFNTKLITDAVFEERWAAATVPDVVELFSKRQGELPKESLARDLPRLKAKLLTIWGMDDRMGALDVGLQITRMVPDGRMHIFTRCGHWAQVEHAGEFNRLVVDFLKV